MENILYKVYAKLDKNNFIKSIESTLFYDENELINKGFVKIDEGENGEIYGHAQPNYLRLKYGYPTLDENFLPNYKLNLNMKPTILTQDEKDKFFPIDDKVVSVDKTNPTEQEKINAQLMLEIAKLKLKVGE